MIRGELRYDDLGVTLHDVYEQMGYGEAEPDEATARETSGMIEKIRDVVRGRYSFFVTSGSLACGSERSNEDAEGLEQRGTPRPYMEAMGREFKIGKIIERQLRGAEMYVFFIATAGEEFERLQHELAAEGDMVKVFIADAIGSVMAERVADRMEEALAALIEPRGWGRTNRFSPGYCGWHVSEQQGLFAMFPEGDRCGVRLTESSLMVPIKSVSGVIGIGKGVRRLEYSCGLCDFKQCYKRRFKGLGV